MTDALDIHVDTRALAGLGRAWRDAPEVVHPEVERAMWEALLLTEREVRERTPIGVGGGGGLAGSIGARDPRVTADGVVGEVGTSLRYAIPVELGRRPGQRPPPIEPLIDWVEQLGLGPEESRGAAYAIARTIARRGTKGAHMFSEGFAAVEGEVEHIFGRARDRLAERLAEAGA